MPPCSPGKRLAVHSLPYNPNAYARHWNLPSRRLAIFQVQSRAMDIAAVARDRNSTDRPGTGDHRDRQHGVADPFRPRGFGRQGKKLQPRRRVARARQRRDRQRRIVERPLRRRPIGFGARHPPERRRSRNCGRHAGQLQLSFRQSSTMGPHAARSHQLSGIPGKRIHTADCAPSARRHAPFGTVGGPQPDVAVQGHIPVPDGARLQRGCDGDSPTAGYRRRCPRQTHHPALLRRAGLIHRVRQRREPAAVPRYHAAQGNGAARRPGRRPPARDSPVADGKRGTRTHGRGTRHPSRNRRAVRVQVRAAILPAGRSPPGGKADQGRRLRPAPGPARIAAPMPFSSATAARLSTKEHVSAR